MEGCSDCDQRRQCKWTAKKCRGQGGRMKQVFHSSPLLQKQNSHSVEKPFYQDEELFAGPIVFNRTSHELEWVSCSTGEYSICSIEQGRREVVVYEVNYEW